MMDFLLGKNCCRENIVIELLLQNVNLSLLAHHTPIGRSHDYFLMIKDLEFFILKLKVNFHGQKYTVCRHSFILFCFILFASSKYAKYYYKRTNLT